MIGRSVFDFQLKTNISFLLHHLVSEIKSPARELHPSETTIAKANKNSCSSEYGHFTHTHTHTQTNTHPSSRRVDQIIALQIYVYIRLKSSTTAHWHLLLVVYKSFLWDEQNAGVLRGILHDILKKRKLLKFQWSYSKRVGRVNLDELWDRNGFEESHLDFI
jgi:hypothetical protein